MPDSWRPLEQVGDVLGAGAVALGRIGEARPCGPNGDCRPTSHRRGAEFALRRVRGSTCVRRRGRPATGVSRVLTLLAQRRCPQRRPDAPLAPDRDHPPFPGQTGNGPGRWSHDVADHEATDLAPSPGLGRPRARGWIHVYSAIAATVMSLVLIPLAFVFVGVGAALACTVYAITLIGLFSVSATYHRHIWTSERARTWMKRADHSMIFVFIAGFVHPAGGPGAAPADQHRRADRGLGGRGRRRRAEDAVAARAALAGRSVLPGAGLGGGLRPARHPGQRRSRRAGADRGRRPAVLGRRRSSMPPGGRTPGRRPSGTTSTSTPACHWRRCVTVLRSGCCCSPSAESRLATVRSSGRRHQRRPPPSASTRADISPGPDPDRGAG